MKRRESVELSTWNELALMGDLKTAIDLAESYGLDAGEVEIIVMGSDDYGHNVEAEFYRPLTEKEKQEDEARQKESDLKRLKHLERQAEEIKQRLG